MAPRHDKSTGGERLEVSVSVKTVTDAVSIMAITATRQADDNDNPGNGAANTMQRIIGVGQVRLPGQRPLQDDAGLPLKINKSFNPKAEEGRGVVYVLEHEAKTGLFKIGYTQNMLNRSSNCKKSKPKLIYETPGGPFVAAWKAKSLARTALSYHNLKITECQLCGWGHDDWFDAPKDLVLETVRAMETFVQLPAYESKNGKEWVLTVAAEEMIKSMGEFSLEGLKSSIKSTEEHPADKTATVPVMQPSQESVTCVSETSLLPSPLTSEEDSEETRFTATPEASNVGKDAKDNSTYGKTKKKIKETTNKFIGDVGGFMGSLLDRSQDNTPERVKTKNL
ncbi:hypothetical protein ColTof4_02910 [Colletotrichum tofieldiae]|nr:hypothetical protein ColTof3_08788 [Colletotrichum tofieldiae]GKT70487.1 hypothetical protein ColTof4_02910 [Colletotrichum tofieldiae]GKT93559.1 hypothetical protein Ct61P_11409 [Colletotrichum tofieldiae]